MYAARGFCAFAPGAVPSAENLRVLTVGTTCDEIAATVRAAASWADGSVKLAQIAFPVEARVEGAMYFWVEWGPGLSRTRPAPVLQGAAQTLYFEEAEVPSPEFDIGAGTLLVRVERHPDLWYYGYFVPTAAILGLLVYRKLRLGR